MSPEVPIPKSSKSPSHKVPMKSPFQSPPSVKSPSSKSPCRRSVNINVAFNSFHHLSPFFPPIVPYPEVPTTQVHKSPSEHPIQILRSKSPIASQQIPSSHSAGVSKVLQDPKSPSPNEVPIQVLQVSKLKSPSHQVPFRRSVNVA